MGLFGFGKKDEYDDIYGQYAESGFEFNYSSKRIGKSKPIFKDVIDTIDATKSNNSDIPLFVNCKKCGTYMDYQAGDSGMFSSWYKCPVCGSRVKESTVYSQLDRENEQYLDSFGYDNDIPECCEACGGPWPDCSSSCSMFDD